MFESYTVYLTEAVATKLQLKQPPVTVLEIEEALFAMEGRPLIDTRRFNRSVRLV